MEEGTGVDINGKLIQRRHKNTMFAGTQRLHKRVPEASAELARIVESNNEQGRMDRFLVQKCRACSGPLFHRLYKCTPEASAALTRLEEGKIWRGGRDDGDRAAELTHYKCIYRKVYKKPL
jgi:hypothetical protein